eukprot:2020826-Rhodomonas_salina.1
MRTHGMLECNDEHDVTAGTPRESLVRAVANLLFFPDCSQILARIKIVDDGHGGLRAEEPDVLRCQFIVCSKEQRVMVGVHLRATRISHQHHVCCRAVQLADQVLTCHLPRSLFCERHGYARQRDHDVAADQVEGRCERKSDRNIQPIR